MEYGGTPPSKRWGHVSVAIDDRHLVVFAGYVRGSAVAAGHDTAYVAMLVAHNVCGGCWQLPPLCRFDTLYMNSVHVFDRVSQQWKRVRVRAGSLQPAARSNCSAAFVHDRVWVFGGGSVRAQAKLGDMWSLQITDRGSADVVLQWNACQFGPHAAIPTPRSYHASARVGRGSIVVRRPTSCAWCAALRCVGSTLTANLLSVQLFGGHDGQKDLGDTYVLSPSAQVMGPHGKHVVGCTKLEADGCVSPVARRFHTFVADEVGQCGVLFGGCTGKSYRTLNDVWVLRELGDWASHGRSHEWYVPGVAGTMPASRWGHSASMRRSCMVVFGGRRGEDLNDVHLLHIGALTCLPALVAVTAASCGELLASRALNMPCSPPNHPCVVTCRRAPPKVWTPDTRVVVHASACAWCAPTMHAPAPHVRHRRCVARACCAVMCGAVCGGAARGGKH